MFKEPHTRTEAIGMGQRRDALIHAAQALDYCKVEPDLSWRLKHLAELMGAAIQATAL